MERKYLKFHHGDVGALLIEEWNLPDFLVSMVKYHHNPDEFIGEPVLYRKIRFIYLSNLFAHYIQDEYRNYDQFLELDQHFSQYFSFNYEEFEELVNYLQEFIDKHQQLFELQQLD